MSLLGMFLGLGVGLTLGLLGGGGSILTVPIFVYLLGFEAKAGIAMSLAVVGLTSLVGAVGHWRAGRVQPRVAALFGAVAMMATYGGARLAAFLSGAVQLTIFGVVMLAAAFFMLKERGPGATRESWWRSRSNLSWLDLASMVGAALAVGALTGLVGVGGGFLIVPTLVLLIKLPMKSAVGTSLLIITMNAASGFAGYVGQVEIAWVFMLVFAGMGILGILLGTYLVAFVTQASLRRAFGILLIVVALAILYQNRAVFQPAEGSGTVPKKNALVVGPWRSTPPGALVVPLAAD